MQKRTPEWFAARVGLPRRSSIRLCHWSHRASAPKIMIGRECRTQSICAAPRVRAGNPSCSRARRRPAVSQPLVGCTGGRWLIHATMRAVSRPVRAFERAVGRRKIVYRGCAGRRRRSQSACSWARRGRTSHKTKGRRTASFSSAPLSLPWVSPHTEGQPSPKLRT